MAPFGMRAVQTTIAALLLALAPAVAGASPAAVTSDPLADPAHPPSLAVVHVPSHGVLMNGIILEATGAGPHPALLLLHGLPGNEQNLDLAQAIRRDGWSVMTVHYRGSWGTPGRYSITHVIEDAHAALAFLRDPAIAARHGIDPARIVVIGHSVGGLAAAELGSTDPRLTGIGLISAADFAQAVAHPAPQSRARLTAAMADNMESLTGTTPAALADEIIANAARWDFTRDTQGLSQHPLLVVTSDDGLAPAGLAIAGSVRQAGGGPVTELHLATDHSYSGQRIALETAVIAWLDGLPARPAPSR